MLNIFKLQCTKKIHNQDKQMARIRNLQKWHYAKFVQKNTLHRLFIDLLPWIWTNLQIFACLGEISRQSCDTFGSLGLD